jgi:hypothetical protein
MFYFLDFNFYFSPITMAARSNTGIVGSNPAQSMEVCVYTVFLLSCVCSGLGIGRSPVQGVLLTVYKIQISKLINFEWAQAREPNLLR